MIRFTQIEYGGISIWHVHIDKNMYAEFNHEPSDDEVFRLGGPRENWPVCDIKRYEHVVLPPHKTTVLEPMQKPKQKPKRYKGRRLIPKFKLVTSFISE